MGWVIGVVWDMYKESSGFGSGVVGDVKWRGSGDVWHLRVSGFF